jgi:outer membrane protein OmpU
MNNFKKVGLTALAASLVSFSANAGEVTVAGGASINSEGMSGEQLNAGTTFSMSNQLTFSGSGELDNGMNVSISFVLDQNDDKTTNTFTGAGSPFDSHSVTVSSDSLGTLVFAGEGGSSAATSVDGTAAGDIWDSFDGSGATAAIAVADSAPGDNSFFYTMPSLMDGLSIFGSYKPQGATAESATGFGFTYTGVEGLSASYAQTDINSGTTTTSGDQVVWKLSYAYGPITAAASNTEVDKAATDSSTDQETSSYALTYTVSDELSVTYGIEEISNGKSGEIDAEYSAISASYTAGGMTISASMKEGDNTHHSTATAEDLEYWSLGASFAF